MRVTAEEKAATRQRILAAAKKLFRTKGFEDATTRDIAQVVGVATGTMFNYFRTKEAIVVELASEALAKAKAEFAKQYPAESIVDTDLSELFFASVAIQLRCLRSLRKYIGPFVDTMLSTVVTTDELAATLRTELQQHFSELLWAHGIHDPSPVQLSIFWSLYVGVFVYWGSDASPKQEDTLALLDQSVRMYVDWLTNS